MALATRPALLGGLLGCTPDVQQPLPPDSVLDAACPLLPPDAVQAVRIPQGTPEESILNVLNSYSAWVNAGTDIVKDWAGSVDDVPDACVEGLAEQGRIAYSQTIFTTQSDVAWQDYYAGQSELTAQSLRNAAASGVEGQEDQGRFELLQEISSSATVNGTFLKFDAVYRPAPGAPADPANWAGLATPSRWYVELVPFDGHFVINYIEHTPSAGS